MFPVVTFPVVADTFESQCPEWLDENYYGSSTIMTAISARMIARKHKPCQYVPVLNDIYSKIMALAMGETGRYMVAGMTVVVFCRDCVREDRRHDAGFELVMYGG
jgi:hypothetical protein